MREERDSASRLGLEEREAAEPELEREPGGEEDHRRDLDDEDEDERDDSREREEQEVRREDAGDRAARPDVRDQRLVGRAEPERDRGLRGGRGHSCRKVEEEVAEAAERVLDVVPEDPEEEHVPDDVRPAPVREHRREDVRRPRVADAVAGSLRLAGEETELEHGLLEVGHLVEEPDRCVDRDQPDRDEREPTRADVVVEGEHVSFPVAAVDG